MTQRAVLVAVAMALASAGCGGDRQSGGATTTTAETAAAPTLDQVKARVRQGMADIRAYSGDVVLLSGGPSDSPVGPGELRTSVLATAGGDLRREHGNGTVSVFHAPGGVERTFVVAAGSAPQIIERRGFAAGPPDAIPGNSEQQDIMLLARVLLDLDEADVTISTYEDRPTWVVQGRLRAPRAALLAEAVALTVDQASGLVVRGVGITNGITELEVRLERLIADPPLNAAAFAPPGPDGAGPPLVEDAGFRRIALEEVAGQAGYAPLVPSTVPAGFRLAEVAFAAEADSTGSDAGVNPPSRRVVSLGFHRGFGRIVVTTRQLGTRADAWSDPFGYAVATDPDRVPAESVALAGGALDGATAQVVARIPELYGTSQLWAIAGDLVVTVQGDLSRDELIAVAQSLER